MVGFGAGAWPIINVTSRENAWKVMLGSMDDGITLQINVCGGDADYLDLTVPALCRHHRENVREVLVVVDECRPQRTRVVNPEEKFPWPRFQERLARVNQSIKRMQSEGLIDRVVRLTPDDETQYEMMWRYMGRIGRVTHDLRAVALNSYILGMESSRTRYVAHYDCDMILYQTPGYDWILDGVALLNEHSNAAAVHPRIAPPQENIDPAGERTLRYWNPQKVDGGWAIHWLSMRALLLDRARITERLPYNSILDLIRIHSCKMLNRYYPPALENAMSAALAREGKYAVVMETEDAWLLHPEPKEELFLRILPGLLESVELAEIPAAQRGKANVDQEAWDDYLQELPTGATRIMDERRPEALVSG